MAAASTPLVTAIVLSQKQRRNALRKERRKRKRQAVAQSRECGLKNEASFTEEDEINNEDDDNDIAEKERLQLHAEWLERERLAQEVFRQRWEREETARRRKEEEERMIKEEWEAQQKKEQEQKEQRQEEKRGREEAVQKMLDEAENQLDNPGPWMNPEAPVKENFGTERDVANCPFFLKTGACRFGDRCSRKHVYPTESPTLLIRGMFVTFGMEEARRDDYDIDAWLEHSEEDLQDTFLDFYHDVLPELKSVGKVLQFKVSCNYEPHLRGNVYVQFDQEEQCKEAFIKFNGRYYAGRQLHCEMCPVTRWKNAICGLFDRKKCPKGKHCNFLHVFRNPGNEFWEADRDLHLSPDRSVRGSRRADGWNSERSFRGERSWRQRTPPRSERSHSRRDISSSSRQRSRSPDRRQATHQHREDKWSSRSRRNDWYSSRSRDRSRSRSRDREQDRLRHGSRDMYRNRSEERDSKNRDTDSKARERSRSSSREEDRKKPRRERSPEKPDKNDKSPNDDTGAHHRRHKSSKKNKKKSKKKHKKKSHLPEVKSSSGESENEKEVKEETVEEVTAVSQELDQMEPIQKSNDLDQTPHRDSEKFSPEVKSEESNIEISSESAEKGDINSS